MESLTDRMHLVAELSLDAKIVNHAAVSDDLDEARFRVWFIVAKACASGLASVAETAEDIPVLLRDPGTEPLPGYGQAILKLAKLLTPQV